MTSSSKLYGRTGLYRLYDATGRLLYVGITHDPKARWRLHAVDKPWWHKVTRKEVIWFETRTEAGIAELRAIETEGPLYDRSNPKNRISDEERDAQDKAYMDEALRMIRKDIEAGVFPRMTALPRERDLADRYGLSRNAVANVLWKVGPRLLTYASPYWLVLDQSSPAGKTARSHGAVYGLGIELFGLHTPFHKDELTAHYLGVRGAVRHVRQVGLEATCLTDIRWVSGMYGTVFSRLDRVMEGKCCGGANGPLQHLPL